MTENDRKHAESILGKKQNRYRIRVKTTSSRQKHQTAKTFTAWLAGNFCKNISDIEFGLARFENTLLVGNMIANEIK